RPMGIPARHRTRQSEEVVQRMQTITTERPPSLTSIKEKPMKSFKSFAPRIALCAGMALGGNAAHAGVPVIDIAAIAQAILEYASSLTEIENQMTQIQSLSQQLTQLQQQYQ